MIALAVLCGLVAIAGLGVVVAVKINDHRALAEIIKNIRATGRTVPLE